MTLPQETLNEVYSDLIEISNEIKDTKRLFNNQDDDAITKTLRKTIGELINIYSLIQSRPVKYYVELSTSEFEMVLMMRTSNGGRT